MLAIRVCAVPSLVAWGRERLGMAGATSLEERADGLVRAPVCGFLVVQGEMVGSEREG